MKSLIAILAITIVVQVVNGQHESTPPPRNTNKSSELKQPAPKSQPTPSPAANVNVINQQAPAPQENRAKEHPQSYFARLLAPENLPNIILCFVGVGGILIAICTLRVIARQTKATVIAAKATRKAAEATEKSVRLQEVAMRQWVDFEDEEVTGHTLPGVKSADLTFGFWITNPTPMVLTLTLVTVHLGAERHYFPLRETLAPANRYPVKIPLTVQNEALALYLSHQLTFPITVLVGYEDAFEVAREHFDACMCRCGTGNFYEFTVLPEQEAKNRESKAN